MGWVCEQSPKRTLTEAKATEPKNSRVHRTEEFFLFWYLQFDFDVGAFSQGLLVDLSMFDLFKLNFIKFCDFTIVFYMDDKYVVNLCVPLTFV